MKIHKLDVRIIFSGAFILFTIGILYTRHTYNLYSGFLFSVFMFSFLFLYALVRDEFKNPLFVLVGICIFSLSTRLYNNHFTSSLLGQDPDSYAVHLHKIIESGSTSVIEWNFYQDASAGLLFSSIPSQIIGIGADTGMSMYAIAVGFIFPISTYILTRNMGGDLRTALISALLISVGTSALRYSWNPIAQTYAAAIWVVLITSFGLFLESKSKRYLVIIYILFGVTVFSHKFSALAVLSAILMTIIIIILKDKIGCGKIQAQSLHFDFFLILIPLGIILVMGQWIFVTDYISRVVSRILMVFSADIATTLPVNTYIHAERVLPGSFGFLLRRGYGIVLVIIGGFAWLYMFIYAKETNEHVLGAVAATVSIMVIGAISLSAINPVRSYLFAEVLLVPIVSMFILGCKKTNHKKLIVIIIFVSIISAQLISPFAIPGSPIVERQYLTEKEVEAKSFDRYLDGEIYTDRNYAEEITRIEAGFDINNQWSGEDAKILNRSIIENQTNSTNSPKYVAVRTNENIYRFFREARGFWKLSYNEEKYYDEKINRIFSNGGVVVYSDG